MSIPLLRETHNEVRRIFIAGSDIAADDFRLKKLHLQLVTAGETAPVFTRVAEALKQVLDPDGSRSDKLLELSNLILAVLYTQGQTAAEGDLEAVDAAGLSSTTVVSYRRLQPIVEALTGHGSGRLEIIREAYSEGYCNDFRLVKPLIAALDDSYPDIADLAAEILKGFGPGLIGVLKKSLVMDGGKGHARRIGLISSMCSGQEKDFFLDVIENGSNEAKTAAVKALKDLPECEELLLVLSRDRKKDIREASLFALSHLGTNAAVDRLTEVFLSKEQELAVQPVKRCKADGIAKMLTEQGGQLFEIILKSEKGFSLFAKKAEPPAPEVLESFAVILDCMNGKNDPETFLFMEKCLIHAKLLQQFKLRPAPHRVRNNLAMMIAQNLLQLGTPRALELLESVRGKFDNILAAYSFEAAVRIREPAYIYEQYAGYVKGGKSTDEGKEILDVMYRYMTSDDIGSTRWDPRWLKLLAALGETRLVCRLITKEDIKYADELIRRLDDINSNNLDLLEDILRGLIQAEYPDIMTAVEKCLERYFSNTRFYSGYLFGKIFGVLRLLPKHYSKDLEDLALKQDNASSARLLEIAQHLRTKE